MSHIVEIKTQVRDPMAIRTACRRIDAPEPVHGTARLFSGSKTGWLVQLSGWRYPLVCDTASGKIEYDNFEGHWGEPVQLDRFLQAYAVERAKLEARKAGHSVSETALTDGSIKLTVQVGGAA